MYCTCPKCGKTVEISPEALAEQEGMVVCPQCLCDFRGTNEQLPLRKRRVVVTNEPEMPHISISCPSCGRGLADDMNFCPYCRRPVNAAPEPEPVATETEPDAPSEENEPDFQPYYSPKRRVVAGRTPVIRRHTPFYAYLVILALTGIFIWLLFYFK